MRVRELCAWLSSVGASMLALLLDGWHAIQRPQSRPKRRDSLPQIAGATHGRRRPWLLRALSAMPGLMTSGYKGACVQAS